uniref:Uncharacterized protein n=1 Tax=Sander lucioperca TaxID=283035 RepID=A0A8D0CYT8_SANLU
GSVIPSSVTVNLKWVVAFLFIRAFTCQHTCQKNNSLLPCSSINSKNYTVPDPPGLFDGHVWPMYLKHKNIMESTDVDVLQLDVTKSKEQLFNFVYGDILNNIQKSL